MGSPSADAQRRSLERGLGGRLGARRSCIGRPSHPSSAAQQQFVVAHSQLSFCIYISSLRIAITASPQSHTLTMDEVPQAAQPQQPRIQQNPHLAECPDFDDESFSELVLSMVTPDRTRDQAIESLRTAWRTQNDRRKALWDAQAIAQERRNEPNDQNAVNREQDPVNDDTTDTRKKPKLGAFAATASIGDEVSLKPSTFAINKLKEMKYIELYCFSPAGCRDHTNQRLSTAEEAFGFTYGVSPDGSAGNALTLKPVSALAHPGKIVSDENLSWEQIRDAKSCYLSHVIEAGWNKAHVDALVSFFINLDSHPYNDTPEGKQALVWYQAHAREDWHRKLGTAESFNLAILNKTLLADFKKKANDLSVQNNVTQVSRPLPHHHNPLTPAPISTPCPHASLHFAHTGHHTHSAPHTPRDAPIPTFEPHVHAPHTAPSRAMLPTPVHHALHRRGLYAAPPHPTLNHKPVEQASRRNDSGAGACTQHDPKQTTATQAQIRTLSAIQLGSRNRCSQSSKRREHTQH
jgi:hypothetical protein